MNKKQMGFDFGTNSIETVEQRQQREEALKKAEEEKKAAERKLRYARESLQEKLKELIKFHSKKNDKEKERWEELLKNADTMPQEEIEAAEAEIKADYDAMAKAKAEAAEEEKRKKIPKHKYPFILHFAGRNIETDYIFEEGKEYTEEEIKTKMLEHQYFEFAGKVSFEYLKEENVLLPIFQQHKKG